MSAIRLAILKQKKREERARRKEQKDEIKKNKLEKKKLKAKQKRIKKEKLSVVIPQTKPKVNPLKSPTTPSVKKLIRQAKTQRKQLKELGKETFSTDRKILKLLEAEKSGIKSLRKRRNLNRLKKLLNASAEIKSGPISNSLISNSIGSSKNALFSTNKKGLNGVLVYNPGDTIEITEIVANRSGRKLVNQLFSENPNKKFKTNSTPGAVGFYEKMGFVQSGEKGEDGLTLMIKL